MKPDKTNQFANLQTFVKNWMSHNFLMINSDKTEVIVLDPKNITDSLSTNIINLGAIVSASSTAVGALSAGCYL